MLEGAVAFASGGRPEDKYRVASASCRTVRRVSIPAGLPLASTAKSRAAKQWMPLWEQPLTYREFVALVAEGRCQIQGRPAQRPLDMARAIARLGVARGITAFERFGYIERNGQSNLATPLGRWRVPVSPPPFRNCSMKSNRGWNVCAKKAAAKEPQQRLVAPRAGVRTR